MELLFKRRVIEKNAHLKNKVYKYIMQTASMRVELFIRGLR